MAQRRMFSRKITESDQFLDMPMSAQSLYFHINMQADDDGFIGNVKTIKRMIGASDDDLKLLIAKQFLIPFETGIVVIRDWKIHNYIQKDRYTETFYQQEKAQLETVENKQYQKMDTECIQNVSSLDTQVRLGKDRLGKDSQDNANDHSDKPNDSELKQRFEDLWKQYPNKKGKPKAFTAYKSAIKAGTTDSEIAKGIENYNREIEIKRTDKQYIAHGSTWFSNKRWTDEYDLNSSRTEYNPNAEIDEELGF